MILKDEHVRACVKSIRRHGTGTIPLIFGDRVRLMLLEELAHYRMVKQPEEFGPHRVKQSFKAVKRFREDGLFYRVRDVIEGVLNAEFAFMAKQPLTAPLAFNDMVAQTYEPGPLGISPHKDGKSYINVIAILVLEGRGRFCTCDDRDGRNPREMRNEPGDLLLMRGPGFDGEDIQPFHFVDRITERRTTFALRQKV